MADTDDSLRDDPKGPPATEELPSSFIFGQSLDWKSELSACDLHVELPFWLATPEATFDVSVDDCRVTARISQQNCEVQLGRRFCESRQNHIYSGDATKPVPRTLRIPIEYAHEGTLVRSMRTVVSFEARVLSDVIAVLGDPARSAHGPQAMAYLHSLARAHVPFLNAFLNAYRAAATDGFAVEVSQWDVPVWLIKYGTSQQVFVLVPYATFDEMPQIQIAEDKTDDVNFATTIEIQDALKRPRLPGEVDIFDAWSLFFRGRYSDCIRALITALEVGLDYVFRQALIEHNVSASDIELRFAKTWNNFEARLSDYCQVSMRRVPGPIIAPIPTVNGVRLEEELRRFRKLRHKIVHEGLRLSWSFEGEMHRAVETMTWLFDWMYDGVNLSYTRTGAKGRYALKMSYWGANHFQTRCGADGIVVINPVEGISAFNVVDGLTQQLVDSIGQKNKDVEFFTAMAIDRLNFDAKGDVVKPASDWPHPKQRYVVKADSKEIPVFFASRQGLIEELDIQQIAAAIRLAVGDAVAMPLSIFIVNHRADVEWYRRPSQACTANAVELAKQNNISVLPTTDLLRLLLGIEQLGWDAKSVRNSLLNPGENGKHPPHYKLVGKIKHFYSTAAVLSIQLNDGSSIKIGDTMGIRLAQEFVEQPISSLQQNHAAVQIATGGCVGITTSLKRSDVPIGADVYVMLQSSSPGPNANSTESN